MSTNAPSSTPAESQPSPATTTPEAPISPMRAAILARLAAKKAAAAKPPPAAGRRAQEVDTEARPRMARLDQDA